MAHAHPDLAFIGFGEAAMHFAEAIEASMIAYDRKTCDPASAPSKRADYVRLQVLAAESNREAVSCPLILSLVTADQALAAAQESAAGIAPDSLFCDMNSVAPATKSAARDAIEAAGGRYVDVAVMGPVLPAGLNVPLLVSGPHAAQAVSTLDALGFSARTVGSSVGDASAIKMIRSVMVKGLEALVAECVLAAEAAGVLDEVAASLDASWPGMDWAAMADYDLERMMVHGSRRAAEMEEAALTLAALDADNVMTRGTVAWQQALGSLAIPPPPTLTGKIGAILKHRAEAA